MCIAVNIKTFEFWGPVWGKTPIVGPPVFVRFSLILISTYSKILIHLAVTVPMFKILKDPIEGDPSNLALPISVAH